MRAPALLLFALAWILSAEPADAHAFLEQATPRVGGVVEVPPAELRLRFSEAMDPTLSQITLTTNDGGVIALGPLAVVPGDERTLVAATPATLAPGVYRVRWRAVSRDAHATTGDFTFRVGR